MPLHAAPLLALLAAALPPGYWPVEKSQPILDQALTVRLRGDLSALGPGERAAAQKLLEGGAIVQRIYEESRHRDARSAYAALLKLEADGADPAATRNLKVLYRMNQGPIATTLENTREPFLPVGKPGPGRNVYPWDATREELEAWMAAHPAEREALLHPRTVVRRADEASRRRDLDALRRHPVLDGLHPGLRARIEAAREGFYAVPYSLAYADDLVALSAMLREAADAVKAEDADLAAYLRHRSRDLLTNDYDAGDAAWVTGRYRHLNVQLGPYESYDDSLFGVKTFFSLSLLVADEAGSRKVQEAVAGLQALEDALPHAPKKHVRSDLPVGLYDIVADFGQARGTNTASILPNDPDLARRYGRTILMRRNILLDPALFADRLIGWKAVLDPGHHAELTAEGGLQRTLWHEVGHYLGPALDKQGRTLNEALQDNADLLEEMKADLASLFVAPLLQARGYYDAAGLRAVQASGIQRVLQEARPRRDQPYQTMQLMQLNWFLDKGLLRWDGERLHVDYTRYGAVVEGLLREVMAVQQQGDRATAEEFIVRWTKWEPAHQAMAGKLGAARRFRLVWYEALGE